MAVYVQVSSYEEKVKNVGFAFKLMHDAGLPKPRSRIQDIANGDLKVTLKTLPFHDFRCSLLEFSEHASPSAPPLHQIQAHLRRAGWTERCRSTDRLYSFPTVLLRRTVLVKEQLGFASGFRLHRLPRTCPRSLCPPPSSFLLLRVLPYRSRPRLLPFLMVLL